MKELKGIIAPIPTPFDEAGELSLDALESNLERFCRTRLSGFAVLGSTGEFVYLTQEEKKAVLERARHVIPASKIMLAGTGCESTRETISLTRWAGALGADFAMVVTPCYYKRAMKPETLIHHYRAVADASSIPIVLYNVPSFTALNMTPDVALALAEHPNIIGIKDSEGDMAQLQEMCRLAPEGFSVVTGAGGLLLAALTLGARGGILAVANAGFDLCCDLVEAFERGDLEGARRLQSRLVPLSRAVTTEHGIGGLKSLLDRIGFYGGPPRAPLAPPSTEVQDRLARIYAEASRQPVVPA